MRENHAKREKKKRWKRKISAEKQKQKTLSFLDFVSNATQQTLTVDSRQADWQIGNEEDSLSPSVNEEGETKRYIPIRFSPPVISTQAKRSSIAEMCQNGSGTDRATANHQSSSKSILDRPISRPDFAHLWIYMPHSMKKADLHC